MSGKKTEACGRCSMSVVTDAVAGDDEMDRDPFNGDRIEVDESEFRRVSPAVYLARIGRKLDAAVQRFTYGR